MTEVEDMVKRLMTHRGVSGIVIVNSEGIPIRSNLDNSTTVQLASQMHKLVQTATGSVRDLDPTNELTFLRIRTAKHEVMIAPNKDYMLIVIQADPDNLIK